MRQALTKRRWSTSPRCATGFCEPWSRTPRNADFGVPNLRKLSAAFLGAVFLNGVRPLRIRVQAGLAAVLRAELRVALFAESASPSFQSPPPHAFLLVLPPPPPPPPP